MNFKILHTILTNRKYLLGLCILLASIASAQIPVSRFSASPQEGCAPLTVSFADQSIGSPTKWIWDLGNGTPVADNNQNPSTIYINPGVYPVKLTTSNANGSDDTTIYVTVYDKPKVDFSISDLSGCAPFTTTFQDKTIAQPGDDITKWEWDFGDGETGQGQNPGHEFSKPGTYNITLTVTSFHGCTARKGVDDTNNIKVLDPININFSFSYPGGRSCKPPQIVQFASASTGPGILNYSWDFGDGQSTAFGFSTFSSHQYQTQGIYSPFLIVRNNLGCIDTLVQQDAISIGSFFPTISGPDTVCIHSSANFSNTSNPLPTNYYWDLGNGVFSSDPIATKKFDTIGTYTIKTINSYGVCTDTAIKKITVIDLPVVNFNIDDTASCKVPFTVNFTDLTPGASTWQWEFGDGSPLSSENNPSHTYNTMPVNGADTVKLTITDTYGCVNSSAATHVIRIQEPLVSFSVAEGGGCIGYEFLPTPDVTAVDGVKSFLWDFGVKPPDPPATAADSLPSFIYTALGNYDITLTITTNDGCIATSLIPEGVKIGTEPTADFSAAFTQACAGTDIQFSDLSVPADKWSWDFGDNNSSTEQNAIHAYKDTGIFTIRLVASNNGCTDTVTKSGYITIDPAVARFKPVHNCTNKKEIFFEDSSILALSWKWDFGDNSTSLDPKPTHLFSNFQNYTVKLIVTNGSCSDTMTQVINILNEIPDFIRSKDSICKSGFASFTAVNINADNIKNYIWDFGDGYTDTTLSGSVSHQYDTAGIFTVKLSVTDIYDCIESVAKPSNIHVLSPKAGFQTNATTACANKILTFTDQSTSVVGNNNIVKWEWKFGDNTNSTFFTSLPPAITHSYSNDGKYFPELVITDATGCMDSVTYTIPLSVTKPLASFTVDKEKSCNNDIISFRNLSTGVNLTYQWFFGDSTTSSALNPKKSYTVNGLYDVSLVIIDLNGCSDTALKNGIIDIKEVKAGFTASSTYGTCIPFYVDFNDTSLNETSRVWSFGDGNFSANASPSHPYVTSDTFLLTLIAYRGPAGSRCIDTATINIIVNAPTATLTYSPLEGCAPLDVKFNVTSTSQLTYRWDFGNGETSPATNLPDTSHTYLYPNNYTPVVVIEDTAGCIIPIIGTTSIKVYGSSVNFKGDTTLVCDNGFVKFTNLSVINGQVQAYSWNFGDGDTSTASNPTHEYNAPGSYDVSLVIQTQNGCTDTLIKRNYITVAKKPDVAIDAISDYCGPSAVLFKGILIDSDGTPLTWNWDFGNGNSSDLQNPPEQQFSSVTKYPVNLMGKSSNGCSDTDSISIIIHPIPSVSAGKDTTICLNNTAQLLATGADNYTWQPAVNLSCINCSNPVASPTDSTTFTVTGTTIYGCTNSDGIFIDVKKPFSLTGLKPEDSVCLGKSITLSVSGAEIYSWSPTAGLNSTTSASVTASPTSGTIYTVTGSDSKNCFTDSASIDLQVKDNPTVNAGADQVLHLGNSTPLPIQYSTDVTSWLWSPATGLSCSDCPAPVASAETNTTYRITVTNGSKCTATDEVFIQVVCDNSNLFLPTAFTPNNDGLNDWFYPMGVGLFKVQSLRIFNRFGQEVFLKTNFNANDRSAGWDGSFKGKIGDPGGYIYILEVMCKNSQVLTINGKILLIQ